MSNYTKALPYANVELGASGSYLVKYSPSGEVLWRSRLIGATNISNVVTDSSGFIYVGGIYPTSGFIVYDSNGLISPNSFGSATATSAFILKYDPNGIVQWGVRISVSLFTEVTLALDSSGNIFIGTGYRATTPTFFSTDGVTSITLPAGVGSNESCFGKYNSSGIIQWASRISGSTGNQNEIITAIAVDPDGNLYVNSYNGSSTMTVYSAGEVLFGSYTFLAGTNSLIVKYNASGVAQWGVRFDGSGTKFIAAMATDSSSNLYITGYYSATGAILYNSDSASFGSLTSAGGNDFVIIKVNSSGFVQWTTRIAGTSSDSGTDMYVDSSGNIYVTGIFSGTATIFNVGGGSFKSLTAIGGGTNQDAIVVKYNSSGIAQWAARMGNATAGTDNANGVTVDFNGNVYVTGIFTGSVGMYNANDVLFGTINGSVDATAAFIVKYNSLGTVVWGISIGGSGADVGNAVTVDALGNLYTTGSYSLATSTIIFSAEDIVSSLPNAGGNDAFIAKYTTSGNFQWATRVAGTTADDAYSVASDSDGNVYGLVAYTGTASLFNADSSSFGSFTNASTTAANIAIIKYNSSGVIQWAAQVLTATGADIGYGITVSPVGNIYVTGSLTGTATVFNANGTSFGTISNSGGTDMFVVAYNTSGTALWTARIGAISADIGYGITLDDNENVYVTGQHTGNATFFNTSNSSVFTLSGSSSELFLAKYNSSGTLQWATRVGSTSGDIGYSVSTSSNGDVYVVGSTTGSVAVYNQDSSSFATTTGALASTDGILVKYNSSGVAQWYVQIRSTGADTAYGVKSDAQGNVYVVGQYTGFLAFTNSDGSEFSDLAAISGNDIFIVKYNSSGFGQWVNRLGTNANDIGYAITLDPDNNPMITAVVPSAAVVYNADGSEFTRPTTLGGNDGMVVRYDESSGNPFQVIILSGSGADNLRGIYASSSGILVAGSYAATLQFLRPVQSIKSINSIGISDSFLAKYTYPGTLHWLVSMESTGADVPNRVFLDGNNNTYVVGTYSATFTIRNADGSIFRTLTNAGGTDGFLVKYNASGTAQWATRISSTAADSITGVTVDSSDNVYVVGSISTGGIFASADDTISPSLANAGGTDVVLVKYNSNGIVQSRFRVFSTTVSDTSTQVNVDSSGNIYVSGYSGSASPIIFYNPDGSTYRTITSLGNTDVFLVQYNSSFTPQWITRVAGTSGDVVNDMIVVPTGGVIIVGTYATAAGVFADTGPSFASLSGTGEAYIVKYSSSGTVDWIVSATGSNLQRHYGICVGSDGSIYVTANNQNTTTITNSDATTVVIPTGGALMKFTPAGVLVWVTRFSIATGTLSIDSSDNLYITGLYISSSSIINVAGSTLLTVIEDYNTGGSGIMVSYDSNGNFRWVMKLSGAGASNLTASRVDSTGSVYFTGNFSGTPVVAYSTK